MPTNDLDLRGLRFPCALAALGVGLAALSPRMAPQEPKNPAPRPAESRPAGDRPPAQVAAEAGNDDLRSKLDAFLAGQGVAVDRERKLVSIRGRFCSPKQPLEYLVTAPHGSHYESLVAVDARPSDVA